ncbi:MAG: cysteine methyltransferase [Paenibacillaceae bacterium]|jgi:methylated-DNA-[protein]-cysteine S-methyltransferase|nr:cysteine methyltransferase [Paenibacillaceae bacterium]
MNHPALRFASCELKGIQAGPVFVMATDQGLCRITWPDEGYAALAKWRDRHMPGAAIVEDLESLRTYVQQLEEYLSGARSEFALGLDLRGTPFQLQVWKTLQAIPHGSTISYTELALRAGSPHAVRAVGAANGSNPVPIVVPCHRAIGKNGKLTGFRGGLELKDRLLRLEGVAL